MNTQFPLYTWEEALSEYALSLTTSLRSANTVRSDCDRITQLIKWANENGVTLQEFGMRHMNRYITGRIALGRSRNTLRHDGVCAKKFLKWCAKNELIEKNRLEEYEVHRAEKSRWYVPTPDEVSRLMKAVKEYWDPAKNQGVKSRMPSERLFYRERNFTLFSGLLDTGCRADELLSLRVEDYRPEERQLFFRHTKTNKQRFVPITDGYAALLDAWMRIRSRVMQGVPKEQDEGWLFVSDNGGKVTAVSLVRTLHRITAWAGLPKGIVLHSFRYVSVTEMVKINPMIASRIVGHSDLKTTMGYSNLGVEDLRSTQDRAGVLQAMTASSVISNKRPERRKRIL